MIQICTVSDKNYLLKGLTLYESLMKRDTNFFLHYLCIDDISYNKISKIEFPNLKVYHIDELTNKDPNLADLRKKEYKYFCWSLASYFQNELMTNLQKPILYIDSDIYFYEPVGELIKEFGQNEVAIFRHRQFPLDSNRPEGLYNVGVVYFKNTEIGKKVLSWWKDSVLFKKYPHLATCGDQKYLDEFPKICPQEKIFLDGNIGHGAPWQWQLYDMTDYDKDENITWEGRKQKLFFTHFSQFEFHVSGYIPSLMHHNYTQMDQYRKNTNLKLIYDRYFDELKKTKMKYDG